jgi:hypothetical protein
MSALHAKSSSGGPWGDCFISFVGLLSTPEGVAPSIFQEKGRLMRTLSRRKMLALGGAMASLQILDGIRPALASPTWIDRQTYGPFHCQATFPLSPYGSMFQELSALGRELERTLAIPPANLPINLYLCGDESTHRKFLSQLYPRVPYRRALYVQRNGRSSVYAYRQAEFAIDMRHECTHALLHSNLAMVPLWLDEGLAEYFEMPESRRASGHPHFNRLRWELILGMLRSVENLEQKTSLSDMGSVEYRFSWGWTHFMLHGPVAAHRVLVHYLADIRQGNPPGKLSHRLHQAIPNLNERMIQHFKYWG